MLFCEENQKLIHIAYDNRVELAPIVGSSFYELPKERFDLDKRNLLIHKLGLGEILSLTPRELDIIKYMAHGFLANYRGKKLHLSVRTIENYIAVIKSKLNCESKTSLIQKSREIVSVIGGIQDLAICNS